MTKTFTISLGQPLAQVVHTEMRRGKFDNASEFFRHLVRHQYVTHRNTIEHVTKNDPDYRLSKNRLRSKDFEDFTPASRTKKS